MGVTKEERRGKRSVRHEGWSDRDRIDFLRCYNESERLYLSGLGIEEIGKKLGLSEERLSKWCMEYSWERRRHALMESPRGISVLLRNILRSKMQELMEGGSLDSEAAKELGDLSLQINKIEGIGGDRLAIAIYLIGDFTKYLRERCAERDEYFLVSSWMQSYLKLLMEG